MGRKKRRKCGCVEKKEWREERGSEDNQITAVEAMEEEGQK